MTLKYHAVREVDVLCPMISKNSDNAGGEWLPRRPFLKVLERKKGLVTVRHKLVTEAILIRSTNKVFDKLHRSTKSVRNVL